MFVPAIEYIYLAMIGIAFLCSLASFRASLPFHLKLLALLLGLTFMVEIYSSNLFHVVHLKNNILIYGPFALCEFWTYGFFFYQLIKIRALRRIVFLFLWIFPIFWLVTNLLWFKFEKWNTYVTVAGSFCSILFVLMYFYQLITDKEIQPIRRLPEFWIATGILIFNLWELPYFGTLNFFMGYYQAHPTVSNGLLNARLILDTLMYVLFSYGYLCMKINTKNYSSP